MFSGVAFLITPSIRPATLAAIHSQGGVTLYSISPSLSAPTAAASVHRYSEGHLVVDCAVQPDRNDMASIAELPCFASRKEAAGTAGALHSPGSNDSNNSAASERFAASQESHFRQMQPDFTQHFSPSTLSQLRAKRIPIVYESYIFAYLLGRHHQLGGVMNSNGLPLTGLQSQHEAPSASQPASPASSHREEDYVAYNPLCMAGLEFTTTQLPKHIKANVIAAMVFYGARYNPNLSLETSVVVYSRVLAPPSPAAGVPGDKPASKLAMAELHAIPCVLPSWVQDCVKYGRLLPFVSPAGSLPHSSSSSLSNSPAAAERSNPHHRVHNAGKKELNTLKVDSPPVAIPSSPLPSAVPCRKEAAIVTNSVPRVSESVTATAVSPSQGSPPAGAYEAWGGIPSSMFLSPDEASRMLEALVGVVDPVSCPPSRSAAALDGGESGERAKSEWTSTPLPCLLDGVAVAAISWPRLSSTPAAVEGGTSTEAEAIGRRASGMPGSSCAESEGCTWPLSNASFATVLSGADEAAAGVPVKRKRGRPPGPSRRAH